MTGDNGQVTHNEPWAMRRYALREGIPASAIYCDYAGFHTYDSCYRARRVFGVEQGGRGDAAVPPRPRGVFGAGAWNRRIRLRRRRPAGRRLRSAHGGAGEYQLAWETCSIWRCTGGLIFLGQPILMAKV